MWPGSLGLISLWEVSTAPSKEGAMQNSAGREGHDLGCRDKLQGDSCACGKWPGTACESLSLAPGR